MLDFDTYVIIRVRDERFSLDYHVDETVDYAQGVEMQVVRILFFYAAVGNLFILLLEEAEEPRTIVAIISQHGVWRGLMVFVSPSKDVGSNILDRSALGENPYPP